MLLMKKLLNQLYQNRAQIFKPAAETDLRALRMTMAKDKMIPLPPDYIQFLTLTDGLMFNGLRFFGVQSHEREKANYAYPSLLEINQAFCAKKRRSDVLIVGEKDEDLLIYSPKNKTYQVMDKIDLVPDLDLPRFFDVIYFFSQEALNTQSEQSEEQKASF